MRTISMGAIFVSCAMAFCCVSIADVPAREPSSPGVQEYLTEEGYVDLSALRASGHEGALECAGHSLSLDPATGRLRCRPDGADGSDGTAAPFAVDDDHWWSGFGGSGTDNAVLALAVFEGDLILAGTFERAGDLDVQRIVRWNGGAWHSLGSGLNGAVLALAVYHGDLVAGGRFTQAGEEACGNIARWDGERWRALKGGVDGESSVAVHALTIYGDVLVAGGRFTRAGCIEASNIAAWNGAVWQPFGTGMDDDVYSLTIHGELLIAGGNFRHAGGRQVSFIAQWDGDEWRRLAEGCPSAVHALCTFQGGLVAGGNWGTPRHWVGDFWLDLGAGSIHHDVRALAIYGDELIAAGMASYVLGSVHCVSHYEGGSWLPLGSGAGVGDWTAVEALAIWEDRLIAGGDFDRMGEARAHRVAQWTGSSWIALGEPEGHGMTGEIRALAIYDHDLIAGGWFDMAGETPANNIARWDGRDWFALGTGVDRAVEALAVFNGSLVAGGQFLHAGTVPASRIASWNGSEWSALGTGTNGTVKALAAYKSRLIAGGVFSQAGGQTVNQIAAWTGQWRSLGSGVTGSCCGLGVTSLCACHGLVYVGGDFTHAGGEAAANIAGWDGSNWFDVGGGLDGPVHALTPFRGKLIAGGSFDQAGGVAAPDVALWDRTAWRAVGEGPGFKVRALCAGKDCIYAGGESGAWGSNEAANLPLVPDRNAGIARWDEESGAWSFPGSGLSAGVRALGLHQNLLYVGGSFDKAGGRLSYYMARWGDPFVDAADALLSVEPPDSGDEVPVSEDGSRLTAEGAVTEESSDAPSPGAKLLGAYPNPFADHTVIVSQWDAPGSGRISVFDLLGREVAVLALGRSSESAHAVSWRPVDSAGRDLSPGVYLIRMDGGGSGAKVCRVVYMR